MDNYTPLIDAAYDAINDIRLALAKRDALVKRVAELEAAATIRSVGIDPEQYGRSTARIAKLALDNTALAERVSTLEAAAKEAVVFIQDNDHPQFCPAIYGGDNPCQCGRNRVYDLLLEALGPEENNDERTEV